GPPPAARRLLLSRHHTGRAPRTGVPHAAGSRVSRPLRGCPGAARPRRVRIVLAPAVVGPVSHSEAVLAGARAFPAALHPGFRRSGGGSRQTGGDASSGDRMRPGPIPGLPHLDSLCISPAMPVLID